MSLLLAGLILAGGASVRTPKIDTCYDWLVSGKLQNQYLSVNAERERENGSHFNNYEASGQMKYMRVSVMENTANDISRQEVTVKNPWESPSGAFEAEAGMSCVWAGYDTHGKLSGYVASRFGNDTLSGSVRLYPTDEGLESAHILVEARAFWGPVALHPFVKWYRIGDERPYVQSKVEIEVRIGGT